MTLSRLTLHGFLVAVTAFMADQVSKLAVLKHLRITESPNRVIEVAPFFDLVLVWNRGVSFGWLSHKAQFAQYLLVVMACALVAWVVRWLLRAKTRLEATAFGLIIGGAVSNALDRLHHGAVVDYLDVHFGTQHWPAFNGADSTIVLGAAIILCLQCCGPHQDLPGSSI